MSWRWCWGRDCVCRIWIHSEIRKVVCLDCKIIDPRIIFFLYISICVSFPFPFVTLSEKSECPHHLGSSLWFSSYNIKYHFTPSMISHRVWFHDVIFFCILVLISQRKEIVNLFRNIFNVLAIFLSPQFINRLLKVCKVINLNSKYQEVFIPCWILSSFFPAGCKTQPNEFWCDHWQDNQVDLLFSVQELFKHCS